MHMCVRGTTVVWERDARCSRSKEADLAPWHRPVPTAVFDAQAPPDRGDPVDVDATPGLTSLSRAWCMATLGPRRLQASDVRHKPLPWFYSSSGTGYLAAPNPLRSGMTASAHGDCHSTSPTGPVRARPRYHGGTEPVRSDAVLPSRYPAPLSQSFGCAIRLPLLSRRWRRCFLSSIPFRPRLHLA